jgi:oligopeptide/dipeptide ABC transporter ATP-binding protein
VVKHFPIGHRIFPGPDADAVRAVDGVSLEVHRGETLGLVGETGCGKSTLARCATRLQTVTAGRVIFDGHDITTLSRRELRPYRRQLQMIFQDPYGSLNPHRRVGSIIGDPLAVHGVAAGAARKRQVQELMELVGRNPEHYNRYPVEFSGGQRHPYVAALLSAVPVPDPDLAERRERIILAGDVPSPIHPPSGCRFHPRCPKARQRCVDEEPLLLPRGGDGADHPTACHFPVEPGDDLAHLQPAIDQPDPESADGDLHLARSSQ